MPSKNSAWVVHLSDLHIGGGHIPKAAGHDENALRALSRAIRDLAKKEGEKTLVVTGDISARGYHHELAMFLTAWEHGWQQDAVTFLPALRKHYDSDLPIPGNHDYWNGIVLNLNGKLNSAVRKRFFPNLPPPPVSTSSPFTNRIAVSTNNIMFWFHGICSTSGANRYERIMGVGAFHNDDLDVLDRSIADATRNTPNNRHAVHFVVTHHSPSHGNPSSRGIETTSLNKLWKVCRKYSTCGILTGHAHAFAEGKVQGVPDMMEVRCSTTLERYLLQGPIAQKLGLGWLARKVGPKREFIVHEFQETSDGFKWYRELWKFTGIRFTTQRTNQKLRKVVRPVKLW